MARKPGLQVRRSEKDAGQYRIRRALKKQHSRRSQVFDGYTVEKRRF
jgi:hypothetical protein